MVWRSPVSLVRVSTRQKGTHMEAGGTQQFSAAFANIKARFDKQKRDGLICKQGFYNDCLVLKLQKSSWTNDPMDCVENKTGIFFSLWIDKKGAAQGRAKYNIHALKLRHLEAYSITSRDFANDFRKHFASLRDVWPNVSVAYGPLTLMQGWIQVDPKRLETDAWVLLERFQHLSSLIDRLLRSRQR